MGLDKSFCDIIARFGIVLLVDTCLFIAQAGKRISVAPGGKSSSEVRVRPRINHKQTLFLFR